MKGENGTNGMTDLWAALAQPLGEPVSVDAVIRRLDAHAAGEHDFTLDLLAPMGDRVAFKGRVQILGVIREGVGTGKTYEAAADAAFLAAASLFNVGGSRAPLSGHAPTNGTGGGKHAAPDPERDPSAYEPVVGHAPTREDPPCPKCGGRVWDNRLTKRNPKAPDFKCRDRSCDGVIWPPREPHPAVRPTAATTAAPADAGWAPVGDDEIPF
jgi:hypothetical protein